jgi:taurine dioxygenase
MALQDVRPLEDGLSFGVRIGGVTLESLNNPALRQELVDLFEAKGMIVFEDIEPSEAMQVALSEVFGPLKEHPVKALARVDSEHLPGVIEIRVTPEHGGIVELHGKQVSHWLPWHFDHCYNNELNRAGVLRAVEIVQDGGITGFADGIAIYNAFPAGLRAKIEGREVLYSPGRRHAARNPSRSLDPQVWRKGAACLALYGRRHGGRRRCCGQCAA